MSLFKENEIGTLIKAGRSIINQITDPFFIADKNLTVQFINDQALSTLEYSREEVVGKMKCSDLCKTPLCNTEKCTLKNCMKSNQPITGQTVAKTRNGTMIPVRAACNALYDKKGRPVGGFEIIADIRTLDEGFLDNMPDAAFRTDKNLVIQNINNSALKALGYRREEVIGKMTCAELCRTPLCDTGSCTIKNCIQTKDTIVGTTVAKTRDGKMLPVRASCGPLLDSKGDPTGGFEILSLVERVDEGFLNNMADAAFRTDKNLIIQNINDAALKVLGYTKEEVVGKMTCADLCRTPLCNTQDCTIKNCIEKKTTIVGETIATARDGSKIPVRASCGVLLDAQGNVTGGFEVISDNTALMRMVDSLKTVAQADLTTIIESKFLERDDSVGKLANSLNDMIVQLTEIILNITTGSQNLSQAVEQIASGNQNLSQRSSEQASALEEIASTLEEASSTIKQNADNAQEANKLSIETAKLAEEGNKVVGLTVNYINELGESSSKISDITTMINDIAFQTNLLALNAAVEAARAGDQGRGFAVVAGEVRNLAQKSAAAVKDIDVLIKDVLEKVHRATAQVNESGESLKEIVQGTTKMSQFISEIATASEEQKQGMDQINQAVNEMDSMTQQNAALVEETAAASEEMANQSQELLEMVERFRLNDDAAREIFRGKKEIHLKAAEKTTGKSGSKGKNSQNTTKINTTENPDFKNIMYEEGFEEF
ncbi:MAG: PAS domain-containing protein [Spirochaetes bacterium]|nr:PAS domain-containing protein [Spirochaetota bacterium]